jgi:hypothetical protein
LPSKLVFSLFGLLPFAEMKTETKSFRQYADIDLNHTFIFFHPPGGSAASPASRLREAFSDRAIGLAMRSGSTATSEVNSNGTQKRHVLVQSFIRTSAFFGPGADGFDDAGDARDVGRGRGSGTIDAVRWFWRPPA